MTYEAWRISYQSSEQAARAAWGMMCMNDAAKSDKEQELISEVLCLLNAGGEFGEVMKEFRKYFNLCNRFMCDHCGYVYSGWNSSVGCHNCTCDFCKTVIVEEVA